MAYRTIPAFVRLRAPRVPGQVRGETHNGEQKIDKWLKSPHGTDVVRGVLEISELDQTGASHSRRTASGVGK